LPDALFDPEYSADREIVFSFPARSQRRSKVIALAIERLGRRHLISSAFALADSLRADDQTSGHLFPPLPSSILRRFLARDSMSARLFTRGRPGQTRDGRGGLRRPRLRVEEEEEEEEEEEGRGEFPTRGV